ncbi:MAG: DUF4339 domain-containing protein [bacterium]|nr:DUF4339 domain-containing protein [bacterium]
MQYEVKFAGQIVATVSLEQLRAMVARDEIGELHKVSSDGETWLYVSQVPELNDGVDPSQTAASSPAERPTLPTPAEPETAPVGDWLVVIADKEYGPYTDELISDLVTRGRVCIGDLVWKNGWDEWRPAEDVFPEAKIRVPPGEWLRKIVRGVVSAITWLPRKIAAGFAWWWKWSARPVVPKEQQRISILAVGSIVLAMMWFFGALSIGAIICSGLALQDIYTSKGYTWGARFAWFGLMLGSLGLAAAIWMFFSFDLF